MYCGSSINVAERTTKHAITLGAGGNKGLAAMFLSRYTDHADRAVH